MSPAHKWQNGDTYWELVVHPAEDRFSPSCAGTVDFVDGKVIYLYGTWRYVDEGWAFPSHAAAKAYADQHRPSGVPMRD